MGSPPRFRGVRDQAVSHWVHMIIRYELAHPLLLHVVVCRAIGEYRPKASVPPVPLCRKSTVGPVKHLFQRFSSNVSAKMTVVTHQRKRKNFPAGTNDLFTKERQIPTAINLIDESKTLVEEPKDDVLQTVRGTMSRFSCHAKLFGKSVLLLC